jgi:hypothetical protein
VVFEKSPSQQSKQINFNVIRPIPIPDPYRHNEDGNIQPCLNGAKLKK